MRTQMWMLIVMSWLAGTAELGSQPRSELEIQIIYDNTSAREDMRADWGFAALVTFRGHRVLFDSGAYPELFLENLKKMGVDPSSIEHAVISHHHMDHRSGIYQLYGQNPSMKVHFLDNFPVQAFEAADTIGMEPHRVMGSFQVVSGIYSTGIIEGSPPEQSLIIETAKGIVLLTGCCHPGVVKMVETVQKQRGKDSIHLLIGGLHMFMQNADQIKATIARLKQMNVATVIPAHCSGDLAKQLFQEAFGKGFDTAGAGRRIAPD
ncbi:MBL fold metallo-hydrolase [Acidobacteria bacterium AH-259-O06]|nr:MBL fold metallo-hydrolase [Acidobacteria bacterium AH-259-O06]